MILGELLGKKYFTIMYFDKETSLQEVNFTSFIHIISHVGMVL
jgi:hypothetical protein